MCPNESGCVIISPPPPEISKVNFIGGCQNLTVKLRGGRNYDALKFVRIDLDLPGRQQHEQVPVIQWTYPNTYPSGPDNLSMCGG